MIEILVNDLCVELKTINFHHNYISLNFQNFNNNDEMELMKININKDFLILLKMAILAIQPILTEKDQLS